MKKKLLILIIGIILIVLVGGVVTLSILSKEPTAQALLYQGKEVKMVVPVMASLKCEELDSSTSTHQMLSSGMWLSKDDLGINTKVLRNIRIVTEQKQARLKLNIYDANKQNPGGEVAYDIGDDKEIEINDLDLTKYSYYLYTEWRPYFTWQFSPSTVSYTYDKFGLTIYSTTIGFSKTICPSSCDLTCPTQTYRDGIVYTSKNTLNFYETTDYLEYWNEPALVGEQLGGTIWNENKNEFCFGGFIYKPGILEMKYDTDYIYPKTYLRQEQCCPGATISTTSENKVCNNNYVWETIDPEEPPECLSDFQCPAQGQDTCQLIGDKYIKSSFGCSDGFCVEGIRTQVPCCPPALGCPEDQICEDYKCVLGSPTPPIDPRYCQLYPDDPICQDEDKCGCWVKIPFTDICVIPDLICHIKLWLAKFQLIFAIVAGFLGGLIGTSYVHLFFRKKEFKKTWWVFLISFLVIGGAVGYLAFTYFLWILLILIVLGIVRAFIPGI